MGRMLDSRAKHSLDSSLGRRHGQEYKEHVLSGRPNGLQSAVCPSWMCAPMVASTGPWHVPLKNPAETSPVAVLDGFPMSL